MPKTVFFRNPRDTALWRKAFDMPLPGYFYYLGEFQEAPLIPLPLDVPLKVRLRLQNDGAYIYDREGRRYFVPTRFLEVCEGVSL